MSGHRFASLIQELPPVDGVIRQSSAVEKKEEELEEEYRNILACIVEVEVWMSEAAALPGTFTVSPLLAYFPFMNPWNFFSLSKHSPSQVELSLVPQKV